MSDLLPSYQTDANRLTRLLATKTSDPSKIRQALTYVDPENAKEFFSRGNFTGEQLARLTPGGYRAENLGLKNNLKALRYQFGQATKGGFKQTVKNMTQGSLKALKEGGGGMRSGVGGRLRYIPQGGQLGAALGGLPDLRNALKKDDPTGKGRSQTERVGAAVGRVAGGLFGNIPHSVTNRLGILSAPLSIGAGYLAGEAGSRLGALIGKGVDKGVSAARGVQAGDTTMQTQKRKPGSGAI